MRFPLSVALGVIAAGSVLLASSRGFATRAEARVVVTEVGSTAGSAEHILAPADLNAIVDGSPAGISGVQPLAGARMQLVVLLDDSAGISSSTLHFGELRAFLESLPATTEVAVGYMRNGTVLETQGFTLDHAAAAKSLRAPLGVPGLNGSPYFALSDLARHWPSEEPAERKAVLMLTDGVDPYYGNAVLDDPYVDASIHDSAAHELAVYSIYLRGAGMAGNGLRRSWDTNFAQSRLDEVAQQTGGHAYFQDFSNPVTIAPFLDDLQKRFANQYRVTIAGNGAKGLLSLKLRSVSNGLKIEAPTRAYFE